MARKASAGADPDLLPEYDFTSGVRGKYLEQYRQGTNLVLLEPDVAQAFPDSAAVNRALRVLVNVAATTVAPPKRTGRATRRARVTKVRRAR
jgi:hypothetical protein